MVASDWLAAELLAAGLPVIGSGSFRPARIWTSRPAVRPARTTLGASIDPDSGRGRLIAAVCVANWLPRKGIVELLEAVAGLPDDVVTLHLVGDTATRGGYAARVHERIEHPGPPRPGRGARPRTPGGGAPDIPDSRRLRAAELRGAGHGTVWGEAMAAGLPVVGWRAGNLPFLAEHGRDGMLVPAGDVPALGGAIEWLARDREHREGMGRAASVRAAARPTWDETATRFFAIIHEVLSAHRRRAPRSCPGT